MDEVRAALLVPGQMVKKIKRVVAAHYSLSLYDLEGSARTKQVVMARHLAIHVTKKLTGKSFPEIGRLFGDRDHTTIMHAVKRIQYMRDKDPEFNAFVEAFEVLLAPPGI